MRTLIRQILNEQKKEKFLNDINQMGLFDFMKITGLSYVKVFQLVGDDLFTRKIMTKFIKDVINEYGPFGLVEIDEDPIFYNSSGDEFREISYLGKEKVIIDVYHGNNNLGDFHAYYPNLNDNYIEEIFDVLIKAYQNGKLDNI
jgi:hypothetical protein